MPLIELSTYIAASPEIVFDLSRSIDLHVASTKQTKEKAVAGTTSGLIDLGNSVTWEATHFGVRQRLTTKIVAYDRPHHFRDSMVQGYFRRFDHDHYFYHHESGTLMRDVFDYSSPLGMLGRAADLLFLQQYLHRLLTARNQLIKQIAESDQAIRFLGCQVEPLTQAEVDTVTAAARSSTELATIIPEFGQQISTLCQDQIVHDIDRAKVTKNNAPKHANRIGQYELLSEIARGGMGVVYKARQSGMNRIVALKMTLAGSFAGEEERRRFQLEAEAAGQLDHPGIVPIFEINEHEGQPFFSMGYVEGQSLKAMLADGPLPPRRAAELLKSMAEAVQYAHSQGIVHRDLKPQNVLVDAHGQPHITDFGLARRVHADSDLTTTGQVLGTPSFMPPEQAAGRIGDIGPLSDVYSLGATLYCLITGRPPFQAANVIDTLKQVCEADVAPPRLINPEIDHDLQTICLKCLQKEPSQRYRSAGELAEDLNRFLNSEPIAARSLNLLQRVTKTLERSRDVREFAQFSRLFAALAVIEFSVEMVSFWIYLERLPSSIFMVVQCLRIVLFGLAIWRYRSEGFLPRNATQSLLWSIWIGYVLACTADTWAYSFANGWDIEHASKDFPHLASTTGLAFFVMGSVYWGWFYLFGILFWALAFLMHQLPEYSQPIFGIAWAIALLTISVYLKRLSLEAEAQSETSRGASYLHGR